MIGVELMDYLQLKSQAVTFLEGIVGNLTGHQGWLRDVEGGLGD